MALDRLTRRREQRPEQGDAELVARVLRGDRESYSTLIRRHQDALYRHARGMGLDPDTAQDVVQDALIKAYTRLAECRDPAHFRSWTFRILRNHCLDHLKNIRQRTVSLDDPAVEWQATAETPKHELRALLAQAFAQLSPPLREAFLLKHLAGHSYDEIAEITDASPSAVKMRVHRAREALRSMVVEETAEAR